ncbi:MAG: oppF3, partial [Ilumatobacteraceae bacterium]|nr:oppF3 [Ilumatobacteraceae bacterium]
MSDVTTASSTVGPAPTAGAIEPLLQVRNLVKNFPIRSGGLVSRVVAQIQAVSDISFDILPGQTLGLV